MARNSQQQMIDRLYMLAEHYRIAVEYYRAERDRTEDMKGRAYWTTLEMDARKRLADVEEVINEEERMLY